MLFEFDLHCPRERVTSADARWRQPTRPGQVHHEEHPGNQYCKERYLNNLFTLHSMDFLWSQFCDGRSAEGDHFQARIKLYRLL